MILSFRLCLRLVTMAFFCVALVTTAQAANQDLLETGAAAKLQTPSVVPAEIKIVSYNIRWRGGEDLQKLIEHLRHDPEIGNAEILGLQEVDRGKKRTGNINTARVIAEALGMNYVWAAPPRTGAKQSEDETGVAVLSKYPLVDAERLILPNAGPGGRRRAAVGATVLLGDKRVRVYSVHAETRVPVERKIDQFRHVLDALRDRRAEGGAVVLGDFNTIKSKDVTRTAQLFADAGFSTPLPQDRPTWRFYLFKLKLDWIWLKELKAVDSAIVRRIGLSDHWPLWVKVRLPESRSAVVR